MNMKGLICKLCGCIFFLQKVWIRHNIGLARQSGLKVPLLPFVNYSGEWSGRVWQPAADSNGRLAHFLKIWSVTNSHSSLQAPTPFPASSNLKKVRQTAITICSGLLYPRRLLRSSRPQEIFQPPQQGFFSVHAQLQLLGNIFQLSVPCTAVNVRNRN